MKTFKLIQSIISFFCLVTILSTTALAAKPFLQEPKKPLGPGGVDPQSLQLNISPEPDLNQSGMVDLFNGKDLNGWNVKGGKMPFTVSNGEIVGTCDPEVRLNSFLVTDASYGDFIFTAEYKWDVFSNSGVMFRADSRRPKETIS